MREYNDMMNHSQNYVSNSTFIVFQIAKKAFLGSALRLCCPVNEDVPQLTRWFCGSLSDVTRKGAPETTCETGTLRWNRAPLRGTYLSNGKKIKITLASYVNKNFTWYMYLHALK
jgi:hypothetical protein